MGENRNSAELTHEIGVHRNVAHHNRATSADIRVGEHVSEPMELPPSGAGDGGAPRRNDGVQEGEYGLAHARRKSIILLALFWVGLSFSCEGWAGKVAVVTILKVRLEPAEEHARIENNGASGTCCVGVVLCGEVYAEGAAVGPSKVE